MQILYSQYQPIINQVSLLFKEHSKVTEEEKENLERDFCDSFIDRFKQVYQMNDNQENEITDLVHRIFKSIASGIPVEIPPEPEEPFWKPFVDFIKEGLKEGLKFLNEHSEEFAAFIKSFLP